MVFKSIISSTLFFILVAPVHAIPTYFSNDPVTDRTAFQAAAGTLALESFETNWGIGTSVSFPIGGPQAFSVSATSSMYQSNFARGVTDGGFSMYITESLSTSMTFTFDSSIYAFGLDVNDLNFVNMSFADDIGNVANNVLLRDNCSPAGGPSCQNIQFFGVKNDQAFNSVTLSFDYISGGSGSIFLDRLEYTSATVPEPSLLTLLSIGLIGMGVVRKISIH